MTTPAPLKNAAFRDPRMAPLLKLASASDLTTTTVPTPAPSSTPTRLRRAQVVAVIVLLVLGAVAAVQQFDLRAQLAATPQLAGQYDRLASIEAQLVEARSLANLRALGVASADPTSALNQAAAGLVAATAQRPGDQATLAEVSQATLTYAALLRAPATAAQLAEADQVLTGTLQPKLQQLRADLQTETGQRSWSYSSVVLWLVVLLAVVGLVMVSIEVAQRSHRTINIGLALALVAAIISGWLGLAGLARADTANQSATSETFDQVVALNQGRLGVADLRHQLTNAALARSASAQAHTEITARLKELSLNTALPGSATTALVKAYTSAHDAAAKGDWTRVTNEVAGAAKTDQAFVTALNESTASVIAHGTSSTQAALDTLQVQAIAALVFALAGAGAGYWGISRRLREYR